MSNDITAVDRRDVFMVADRIRECSMSPAEAYLLAENNDLGYDVLFDSYLSISVREAKDALAESYIS